MSHVRVADLTPVLLQSRLQSAGVCLHTSLSRGSVRQCTGVLLLQNIDPGT